MEFKITPERQRLEIANKVPLYIPNALAKKVISTFQQTIPTHATIGPSDRIQRPLLLQKGLTSKLVNLIVKIILGKTLYTELKAELRQPVVSTLVERMNSKEGVTAENLKGVTHKEVAEAHLQVASQKEENNEYGFLETQEGWNALDIRRQGNECKVIEAKVCPTSERALGMEQHLNNIYVKIDDTGRITITCGVINSKDKADEFVEAVKWAVGKRGEPSPPLRISMHQLNSMGVGPGVFVAEKTLVEQQHNLTSYINSELSTRFPEEKGPFVSHTNRCLNGFTQIKGEDAKSHAINREGLIIQMRWLCDDISNSLDASDPRVKDYLTAQNTVNSTLDTLQHIHTALLRQESAHPDVQKKLEMCNQKIADLILADVTNLGVATAEDAANYDRLLQEKAGLEYKQAEIKALKHEVHKLEKSLESQNKQLCRTLHTASFATKDPDTRTKLELATEILASQTGLTLEFGLKKLSATEELACMLLLDHMLNVVTEINCKSGLDRTGFTRSLQTVVQKKVKEVGLSKAFDFITKFDENVQKIDQNRPDIDEETTRAVEQFQRDILRELKAVAIPITERSSGLKGLKWHWGLKTMNPFQANPHPLNWLPRTEGSKINIELANGKRKVTDKFAEELCGLSQKRGG
jgi:hypothetical protein